MIKFTENVLGKLGRVPKAKPKANKIHEQTEEQSVKKIRHKKSWNAKSKTTQNKLERTPSTDTVEVATKTEAKKTKKDTRTRLGDFLVHKNKLLAEAYKDDLEKVAMQIPEASFFREVNNTSAKELKSMLEKLQKREEQFQERGFKGVIRDGVRATIFMPDADKNYMKIVDAMKKKGYKVALNFAEDAQGNAIKNPDGTFKMVEDIDVRFGKNACQSGYEDVQLRFQKDGTLYELIILPGPHYMSTKNREHDIYDQFKRYRALGFEKDAGALQMINAIREKFAELTRLLYFDAKMHDKKGILTVKPTPTFSDEDIKYISGLFKSLKNLYLGKFESRPPSKRSNSMFKGTKTYFNLNDIECQLRKIMDKFKSPSIGKE